MRSLSIVCVLASAAQAEPVVRPLASTNGAWVVTPPELAAELNARIAKDWKAKPAGKKAYWNCKVGYMMDALVSWRCEGGDDPDAEPSVGIHRTFWIRGGKLVPFDIGADVKSMAALADAMHTCGTSDPDPIKAGVFISAAGLEAYRAETAARGCVHSWPTLYKALRADKTLATIVRTAPADSFWENAFAERLSGDRPLPTASTEKTPSTRFVAVGDYGVRDTSTGLIWIARQPPDEVNAAEAAGLASVYRGGGHSDWRLPRIGELAALSTADLAHTEAGDCTAGKSKYTITPLIHLSCGLAWSLSTRGEKTAAWGFVSGTARLADGTEKKNYRVLMVRGPD